MNIIITIPAFNEERTIGRIIQEIKEVMNPTSYKYKILVLNDGSKDKTAEKIIKFITDADAKSFAKIIGYEVNKGKGNAVAFGVRKARGEKILFIDADGSISPEEIPNMLEKLNKHDVVVGDRLSARSKIKTNLIRKITSLGFNSFVSILFQDRFRDNLCGFKGFRRNVAKDIFSNLLDKRWVFDVELFFKIKKRGYPIYSLPIKWKYVDGSRINILIDPLKWFLRLIKLRVQLINYK